MEKSLAFLCLTLLFFGFNNCSNDTRFSTANSTKASSAGNGTPYGGNTGNGTPYGGIRKGTYLAFHNSVCPTGEKEAIEVVQNPDNSLLVTATYECRDTVEAIPPQDVSVTDSGTHLVFKDQVFAHEKQDVVAGSDLRVNLVCQLSSSSGTPNGGTIGLSSQNPQVIYYSGTDSNGNFSHFLDRVQVDAQSKKVVAYTQQVELKIRSESSGTLYQLPTHPNTTMEFQKTSSGFMSATLNSSLFSAADNLSTSQMTCIRKNKDPVDYWNN